MADKKLLDEILKTARLIEEWDQSPKRPAESWKDIHEEYSRDEYPPFGGPFTDAISPWEWLEKYYNPPTKKN